MAAIETPRTDAGNATLMSNSHAVDFSAENSLLSPIKKARKSEDIISLMRNERGASLRTPRPRVVLADRKNLPAASRLGEFTPLIRSVTKDELEESRKAGGPVTPAFLKATYQGGNSPALPGETSAMYASDFGSSVIGGNGSTPMPQVASSSAQSTPLAVLPKRDATGVLTDQGNVMTLREQEGIINKIEKENFGLKLKIHFLEDALRRAGPGFNEAALQENTDLKVNGVTMQRELAKCKKTLIQAEQDLEAYRRHLQEVQAKAKKNQADESVRRELEELRTSLQEKEDEVEIFRERLDAVDRDKEEFNKLRGDIEDLEADIRDKDRQIDERDDEIDRIKAEAKKESEELDEVYDELESDKKRIEELEAADQSKDDNAARLKEAQDELQDALAAQSKAETDLEELQDEMANKSFTTKGLSRQLEEKATKLQTDVNDMRQKHAQLQDSFEDKSRQVRKLEDELQSRDQDAGVKFDKLQDQHDLLRHDHDSTVRKCESLNTQLQQTVRELQNKSEEKDLLHSRHDALTSESQTLQRDLSRTRAQVDELEESLDQERKHAAENDRRLRAEAVDEINRLSQHSDQLQRELETKESKFATERDQLESQHKSLKSQKEKSDERADGLQRTIDKLQEVEGTLSNKEVKLQEALASEKQRHQREEDVLNRQIKELTSDLEDKRQDIEELRSHLSQAKEDVRTSERDQNALEEKVLALEDEVEVLQDELDGEGAQFVQDKLAASEEEVESLRAELVEARQQIEGIEASRGKEQQDVISHELQEMRQQLQKVEQEKRAIQDQLTSTKQSVQKLQGSSAEVEAERDEVRSQLDEMRNQLGDTFKLDQEKTELRTSKMKLDNEVGRLRDEKKGLLEKMSSVERELEAEIERASSEEGRLKDEISELQKKSTTATGSRGRELSNANKNVQRLETKVQELEKLLSSNAHSDDVAAELSVVQNDLSKARAKETEYLQREAAQKSVLRELKSKVSDLERRAHEAEVAGLNIESPKSSGAGSAIKSEVAELQRQLDDLRQQLRESRNKSKDELKSLQRQLMEAEKRLHSDADSFEQQREQLEADLSAAEHERETLQTKNNTATQTITRLRTRISSLEQDISNHRHSATADHSMVEERRDLHEMLKDAKLQAEDLQIQVDDRESSLEAATTREKEMRAHLRRLREERNNSNQKSSALSTELHHLQSRYESAVDNLTRKQRQWDDERKAITSRVRFANTSVSSLHANDGELVAEMEKRHAMEFRGLAKQIQWLQVKLQRETGFREGLVFEKKYLSMQVKMFEACNKADLDILKKIGITPPALPKNARNASAAARLRIGDKLRKGLPPRDKPRPTLKTVGVMMVAIQRMKMDAEEWRGKREIRESLRKGIIRMKQKRDGRKES